MIMSTHYKNQRFQKMTEDTIQTIDQFKKIIGQIPEDRSINMMFQLMFDMLKLLCTEEITAANFSYALDRMASQMTIANKHDPMRDNAFRKTIYILGESIHNTTQTLVNKRPIRGSESCDEAIVIPDDQFMSVIIEHCLSLMRTVRSKKLVQGNLDMLLESMAADRDVTARHDVMKDSPLRKLVYALSEAIEMTVRILLEKNRPAPAAGVQELNLRNVKAEPVIEEDWSFSDATEPIKDGSGDAASGVIQDDIDDAAVEDVPMTVNDDIIPLTDDAVVDDASIHSVNDEVMADDAHYDEIYGSVECLDEIKAPLFMKESEEIKEEVDEEVNAYEAKENFLDFSHHKDDDEDEEENGAREEEEQDEVVELEQEEGRGEEEVKNEERENEEEVAEHLTISPNEQNDRRSKKAKSAVRLKNDLNWNMVDSTPALSQAKTARKSRQLSCKACGHISQTNRQADNHRLECTGNASKGLHSTQDKTISKKFSKLSTTSEHTPKSVSTSVDVPKTANTPKAAKASNTCRRRSLSSSKSWKRSCGGYFKMPPVYSCILCEDKTLRPLRGLICHLLKGHQNDKKNTSAFLQDLRYECVCGFAAEEVHQCYDHEKKCAELEEGSLLLFHREINSKIPANQMRPKYSCRCKFTTENKADVWKHKDKCPRSFFTVRHK